MSIKSKIFAICLVIFTLSSLCIGVFASSGDNDVEAISPAYEAHECHSGPFHGNCEYDSVEEDCGCLHEYMFCCCGKLMYFEKHLCEEHQY